MDFSKEEGSIADETKPPPILGVDYNNTSWMQQSSANITGQDASSENVMLNMSPLSTSSNGNATEMRSNDSGDAEGVWSPDIDQAFHEALQIYPPCGRRKIILSDEGKMYGRNELIARYIKIRCGKTRTRKQVSSHIQVLARKKTREEHARLKGQRESNNLTDATALRPPSNSETGSISPNIHNTVGEGTEQSVEMNSGAFQPTDVNSAAHNAASLASQPLANLITSVNRDRLLKAASAISMGTSSPGWPYPLHGNNLFGINSQLDQQLYMAAAAGNQIQLNQHINANSSQISQNCVPKIINQVLNSRKNESEATTPFASTSEDTNNLTIASSKLILIGFTAYIEQNLKGESSQIGIVHIPKISNAPLERISLDLVQSKYPPILQELFKKGPSDAFFIAKCWANMNFEIGDEQNTLFAVDSYYESAEKFDITVSTKVCSFGNEVVEKVEIYSPIIDEEEERSSGIWHFKLEKSPMCEYMVRFISELKKLQEPPLMNSVLENFTVLQIVANKKTEETLMVLAFIFEIREDGEDEIYTNIYRLTDE